MIIIRYYYLEVESTASKKAKDVLTSFADKVFNSFESLNTFINELVDLKNESELNALESQTYEG